MRSPLGRRAEALALEADLAPREVARDAAAAPKIVLELLEEAAAVGLAPERDLCCWATTMEFERSDPPSALKSRRPQTVDVERRSSAPSRATSPPPPSQERRHTIENSAAWRGGPSRTATRAGRDPSLLPDGPRAALIMMMLQIRLPLISEECQAPRRSWAQAMELTGDIRRPELSPVVEESSPDSDRSTPQPTIPLEDHLGDCWLATRSTKSAAVGDGAVGSRPRGHVGGGPASRRRPRKT